MRVRRLNIYSFDDVMRGGKESGLEGLISNVANVVVSFVFSANEDKIISHVRNISNQTFISKMCCFLCLSCVIRGEAEVSSGSERESVRVFAHMSASVSVPI